MWLCLDRLSVHLSGLPRRCALLFLLILVPLYRALVVVIHVIHDLLGLCTCPLLLHFEKVLLLLIQLLHSLKLYADLCGVLLFVGILDLNVVNFLFEIVRCRLQLLRQLDALLDL